MVKNVSKQTVVALFVLTIVVMLAGTLTVYFEVQNAEHSVLDQDTNDAMGEVSLNIREEPQEVTQEGEVSITVEKDSNGGQR